jgi:Mg-chelatase subunit ChlD
MNLTRVAVESILASVIAVLAAGLAAAPAFAAGDFEIEILEPAAGLVVPSTQQSVRVAGSATAITGFRRIDLFLVMDTSGSLRKSDPDDRRSAGAIALVKSLLWSDAAIGVVDFDKQAKLVSPLTGDRTAVMAAIRALDQEGKTDLAAGIRTALAGFEKAGRPGASRVMLLFTDGRSNLDAARVAMAEAKLRGVSISTVQFGSDERGAAMLREIADSTGGSFVEVRDPAELPDAFVNLRTTGVERVALSVNGAPPIPARLSGGAFEADVALAAGENRIVARAVSVDGREREAVVSVRVRAPGCAELRVLATQNGVPALSLSRRAVEIVVDASGSMWGRMDGRAKIEIAKEILDDALEGLPAELELSLRAYGHQSSREAQDCQDTQLLVAPGAGNRAEIRRAIRGLQPKGHTPIAYTLGHVAGDFGDFAGERAVVLVTDGLESCGGDPVAEARALREESGVPVHVIGFGLADGPGEDLSSLRAIAEASGGEFLTAVSGAELREALGTTVGTPFRVLRRAPGGAGDGDLVARGTLGAEVPLRLPGGDYTLVLDGAPSAALPLALAGEEKLTLVLQREGEDVVHSEARAPAEYAVCEPEASAAVEASAGDGAEAATPPGSAPVASP